MKFKVGTKDVSKSVSQVIVVTPKNNSEDYNLPTGIIQKIDKHITEKENGFFTLYENETTRLLAVFA